MSRPWTVWRLPAGEGRARRRSLFGKYMLICASLVGLALLASGLLQLWFTYKQTTVAQGRIEREQAATAGATILQFFSQIEPQLALVNQSVQAAGGAADQRRAQYEVLIAQSPPITRLRYVDADGREQLSVSRLAATAVDSGNDFSQPPSFPAAKRTGRTAYGPVEFHGSSEPYLTMAVPERGAAGGVLLAEVNLRFVGDVVSQLTTGQAGYAYVVDGQGHLIAHHDVNLVLQYHDLSVLPQVRSALSAASSGAPVALLGAGEGDTAIIGRDLQGRRVLSAHQRIDPPGWIVFVDQPLSEAYAPVYGSIYRAAALLIAGLALAVLASFALARHMVAPIRALQAGTARIGAGGLDQRIDLQTGDELEALGEEFNRMAAQLQDSYAGLEQKVADRTRELTEALEREQATAEVLRVISRSPESLDVSLQAVADTAARLCRADFARVFLLDGEYLVPGPSGPPAGPIDGIQPGDRLGPIVAGPPRPLFHTARTGQTFHAEDLVQHNEARGASAEIVALARALCDRLGGRSMLIVPMLRGADVVGVIRLARTGEARPFSEREIALAESFADQAAIAVENARLFQGIQERNRELATALERADAMAETLTIISGSPTDVAPVMKAIATAAERLCRADHASVVQVENGTIVRSFGYSLQEAPSRVTRETLSGAAVLDRRAYHVADVLALPPDDFPIARNSNKNVGARTALCLPLLHGEEALGAIGLSRQIVKPFSDDEIALAQTFASQAVIALENARLFEEVQARTREAEERNRELTEALEQQTATGEILSVISRSPTDVQPVMEAIVQSAQRLCGADITLVAVPEGERFRELARVSTRELPPAGLGGPRNNRRSVQWRAFNERHTIHVHDLAELVDSEYPEVKQNQARRGHRTVLATPLLRRDEPIGVLVLGRFEVRPFSDQQIALLETFADQAVIAIENVRLFHEIQEKSRQLEVADRAKSEFLSRMSHELRTPLNAILGFAEIMEMDPQTPATQQEWIQHVLKAGRHLLGLINEVLDIARIETGRLSLSIEPVSVDGVVHEVLDLVRPLAARGAIELELFAPDGANAWVRADRQRLQHVLLNLLTNAIKYNRPGGSVTLSVSGEQRGSGDGGLPSPLEGEGRPPSGRRESTVRGDARASEDAQAISALPAAYPSSPALLPQGEKGDVAKDGTDSSLLRLTVRDTGPGIPADKIRRLFTPFDRLGAEESGIEGNGLGLAIAKRLIEAMGGATGVESVEGEGSAFWIDMPPAAPPSMPGAGVQDPVLLTGGPPADGASGPVATVLYIEDNLSNLELMKAILAFRPGITLLSAMQGTLGLTLAQEHHLNLILLDLNLPDMHGDEVLTRLQQDTRTRAVPVAVISADATPGQQQRTLALGADAYLTKPLDVKQLLDLLEEVLAPKGATP